MKLTTLHRYIGFSCIIVALGLLLALWLTFPITLITGDIGRHITDGNVLIKDPQLFWDVTTTNFYSFTHGEHRIVNHHWLSGLLFALAHTLTGFLCVHILFIVTTLCAFFLFFDTGRRLSNVWIALWVSVLLLPLIADRTEVRPEAFGYLFAGLLLWLFLRESRREIPLMILWIVPLIILLWTNMHASFPVGLMIIGLSCICELIRYRQHRSVPRARIKHLVCITGASFLVTLMNPSFLAGALYPFSILRDAGYAVMENQSIWFLETWGFSKPPFFFVKVCTVLLIAGIVYAIWIKKIQDVFLYVCLSALILLMSWLAVRHMTLLGFMLVPTFCVLLLLLWQTHAIQKKGISILALLIVSASLVWQGTQLSNRWIVLGLEPGVHKAATFMRRNSIQPPFYSNFDIGGYMIYHFYPIKVYADNRPEAYPPHFWRDLYVPMQQDQAVWLQELQKYRFNAIVLYYRDRTTWAQTFIKNRLQDPAWVPVFADKNVIVLVAATEENLPLIKQFAIPKERFGL